MNPHLVSFLFGMAGNATIEVIRLLGYAHRGRYHRQYADWRFWTIRCVLVVFASVMALAYSLNGFASPLLAFHVGAAATLLIKHMATLIL